MHQIRSSTQLYQYNEILFRSSSGGGESLQFCLNELSANSLNFPIYIYNSDWKLENIIIARTVNFLARSRSIRTNEK